MSGVNETSGLSSARQITDATSVVIFSPNDTSSDIMKIILTFPKREKIISTISLWGGLFSLHVYFSVFSGRCSF
jgi:hypothetical protein